MTDASEIDNQLELASAVVDVLEESGHDITRLDLLDGLASAGVKLAIDLDAVASRAYGELLK